MILVDASVWADHLRRPGDGLTKLLEQRLVLGHPFARGEIALGNLRDRKIELEMLDTLPQAIVADDREVAVMIEKQGWFGRGIGYVDAHLLAATLLTPSSSLWTRDRRLALLAGELGRAYRAAA